MSNYNSVVVNGKQVIGGYKGLSISKEGVREFSSVPSNFVSDYSLKCSSNLRRMYGTLSIPNDYTVSFNVNKSALNVLSGGSIVIKHFGSKTFSYIIEFDASVCWAYFVCPQALAFYADEMSLSDLSYDNCKEKITKAINAIKRDMEIRDLGECMIDDVFNIIIAREQEILAYLSDLINNVDEEERETIKGFLSNYGVSLGREKILTNC